MNKTEYAREVLRFGSLPTFTHEDGRRYHVSHETCFGREDLETDGKGNILKSPLLKRKPCFGRPEAFLRSFFGARAERIAANCKPQSTDNKCDLCPVFEACSSISEERIDSDHLVKCAVDAWFQGTNHLPDNQRFRTSSKIHLWAGVINAITAHGGWTNINDLQVILRNKTDEAVRKQKRRDSAKASRLNKRAARNGVAKQITPEFMSAVAVERDRRLRILEDAANLRGASRRISKLAPEGRRRTADVWEAQTLLARHGSPVTGLAIAEWLVRTGKVYGVNLASLRTFVYRDLIRIVELESGVAGAVIWAPFNPPT